MQWAAAVTSGRPNGSAAMSAAQVQQAVAAAAAAAQQQGGLTRGRSRESRPGGGRGVDPEQRRRAQSKSPARAAAQENPGISKKFREFKEWCKGSKSHSQLPDVVDFGGARVPSSVGPLKSNLKKNLSSDLAPSPSAGTPADSGDVSDSNDNRKVHFNKFATVQMME